MSVKARIWILLCCFVLGIIVLYVSNVFIEGRIYTSVIQPQLVSALTSKYEYALKSAVDIQAENLAVRVKSITDRKATYALIERETDYQRFFPEDEGYYFTYTTGGVRINVPINKSANGNNLITLTDPDGFPFIREFVRVAQAGGGFVRYLFEKPGKGVLPKLSYVRLIPGTNVLIGAGVYIDSVAYDRERFETRIKDQNVTYFGYQLAFVGVILLLVLTLGIKTIRSINRPLQEVTAAATRIADGDVDTQIQMSDENPKEIVLMNKALHRMVEMFKGRSNGKL